MVNVYQCKLEDGVEPRSARPGLNLIAFFPYG